MCMCAHVCARLHPLFTSLWPRSVFLIASQNPSLVRGLVPLPALPSFFPVSCIGAVPYGDSSFPMVLSRGQLSDLWLLLLLVIWLLLRGLPLTHNSESDAFDQNNGSRLV